MCLAMDANRTLSQLSYEPIFNLTCRFPCASQDHFGYYTINFSVVKYDFFKTAENFS